MGLISSIGDTVEENRMSLQQERSGISQIRYYETAYAGKLPAAEVRHDSTELNRKLFGTPNPSISRTSLLALHAAGEAIQDSGLSSAQLTSTETALVGATTVGGMCLTDELYHDALAKTMAHLIYLPTTMHQLRWRSRNDMGFGVKRRPSIQPVLLLPMQSFMVPVCCAMVFVNG